MNAKSIYDKTHHVSTLERMPKTAHYAALVQKTRSYMDQWSDMNGGKPFQTSEQFIEYVAFDDEEALNDWILDQNKQHTAYPYLVFRVVPVEVKLHTTVTIQKE